MKKLVSHRSKIIAGFLFIFVSHGGWAQISNLTSLSVADTTYVNELVQQSFELIDPTKSYPMGVDQRARELSERGVTGDEYMKELFKISAVNKSLQIAKQAIRLSEEIHYPKGKAYALKNIGFAYYCHHSFIRSNRDEAFTYWREAVQVLLKANDTKGAEHLLKSILADVELLEKVYRFQNSIMTSQLVGAQQFETVLELGKQKTNYYIIGFSGLLILILSGILSVNYFLSRKSKMIIQ